MAILAPTELPSILRVRSEPMKKYVLSKLGFPVTEVEITEDQWETIWRVSGDFIAQYFPREQKLGMFYTTPLQPTYPLPEDAYWVQEVAWDPVTTRIDDVFGAESFLFCLSPEFQILDKFGELQPLGDWKKAWKAKTPFGDSNLSIKCHNNKRMLPKIRIHYDSGIIEATSNHVLQCNLKWREFGEVKIGDKLSGIKDTLGVQNLELFESTDAISLRANKSGCYYGCTSGSPILIH
jgi:hypothetical protein